MKPSILSVFSLFLIVIASASDIELTQADPNVDFWDTWNGKMYPGYMSYVYGFQLMYTAFGALLVYIVYVSVGVQCYL